jgi:phospholipid transport system transporter-binding protein
VINNSASIRLDHDCLRVAGEVNFMTAVSLWNQSLPLLQQCKKLVFDLKEVLGTNSAAVVLLLEWVKYANQQQKSISFQNLPHQLVTLAAVSGVIDLFNQ